MKRTKIVATIGPASENKIILEKMIRAGLNVARLNFSHSDYSHHQKLINNIRAAARKLKTRVAIIQDLQGPRIRLGQVAKIGVRVKNNQAVFLMPENYVGHKPAGICLPIQYFKLYKDVKAGQSILIDEAKIELTVLAVKNKIIKCRVKVGGLIKSHQGMNFPQSKINCAAITKKDLADVEFGIKNDVDFVALSFVKSAKEIISFRRQVMALEKKYQRGALGQTKIIAKIERREAIKNFPKILAAADAIMIARGDLGIELPFEDLPLLQKKIINKCRQAGKPVIVATQMLDSMTGNPRPTRAEVSDVANAVLDGTDAIMLSGETATGQYPLQAVAAMARIAQEVEGREISEQEVKESEFKNFHTITQVMSFMAQDLAEEVSGTKLIVCATVSGFTAQNIGRFRPSLPIVAFTPAIKTANQLGLSWGVTAYLISFTPTLDALIFKIKKFLAAHKLVKKKSRFVVMAGQPFGRRNQTSQIVVERV